MAHFDPIPRDTLDVIAKQIGERLSSAGIDALKAGKNLEIGATLSVWMLGLDATTGVDRPLDLRAVRTGLWHHQIRHNGEAIEFARSMALGPNAEDWQVQDVTTSQIPQKIESALGWVDNNVHDDPLVRLLIVPAYYLHALWLVGPARSDLLIVDRPEQYSRLAYNRLYGANDFLEALVRETHASGLPQERSL